MDLALMATSYWKIVETIETLAAKLEITLGICLNLVNSVLRCDQVCDNIQKCAREYFAFNFFWVQFCTSSPEKKRLVST
jgi:hypothetical protein